MLNNSMLKTGRRRVGCQCFWMLLCWSNQEKKENNKEGGKGSRGEERGA
jgi:hypothetical protein